MGTTSATMLLAMLIPVHAANLQSLKVGSYVPSDTSCDFVGSAASVSFDGANLTGHNLVCLTKSLPDGKYRSDCLEAQGEDRPTSAQIASSPDKESETFTLKVTSPTSFIKDNTVYKFCPTR